MKWKSQKPWIKGLIIGLTPLAITIVLALSATLIQLLTNHPDGGTLWLLIPLAFFGLFALIFFVLSLLIGLIIQFWKNKKFRLFFIILTITFLILNLIWGYFEFFVWVH